MSKSSPWLRPRTAYIHIPFCAHHCGYCDFAVATGHDHTIPLYLESLRAELSTLKKSQPVSMRFLGGGTPTHLDYSQLTQLFQMLDEWLPLTPEAGQSTEFSIESTPDSLDPQKVQLLRRARVNRVSVGIQTFHDHLLPVLDRRHRADQIRPAIQMVRESIEQFSLDLIFAVPGQTLDDWKHDLDTALTFEPDHISTYGLTFEKGTPLWKDRERGVIRSLDEDLELSMYVHAMERLQEAGYEHYEISNFAKPGKRCRHNEVYWANHAYFGFGMGAAGYVNGVRTLNSRNLHEYMRRALSGEPTAFQSEVLDGRERAFETLAVQLRRMAGVNRTEFEQQTGFALDALAGEVVSHLVEIGLLVDDGTFVALTRQGKCVADGVIAKLMAVRESD